MHIVSTAPSLTVVTFRVGGTEFALAADRVRDVLPQARPTRVPGAHAWYDGILPWRGQIVPVLNLARRLGLMADGADAVLVLELDGEWVGVRVDALLEENPVPLTALEPGGPDGSAEGLVNDRRVVLLDLPRLIAPPATALSTFPAQAERAIGRRGTKRA